MSAESTKRPRIEGSSEGPPTSVIKISQRPPKSCTECIRRKTRCNKQVPCEPCLKRKVGHTCRLESQYMAASSIPRSPDSAVVLESGASERHILAEIESLQRRISDLERSSRSGGLVAGSSHEGGLVSQVGAPRGSLRDEDNGEPSDAGTTLEYLALGMDRRLGDSGTPVVGRRSSRGSDRPSLPKMINHDLELTVPESVSDALLPRHIVTSILAYAESHVLWQHCCIHPPTFNKEVDAFWAALADHGTNVEGVPTGWASLEPTWIALLYVVMGIAVHQMDDLYASRCGLSEADRLVLPNAFVSAAEDALHAGSFMTRPSLWTVQAIAILSLCGHNVCDSDLLSSLLAVGIKMAQSLGLHSLGRRSRAIETRQSRGVDLSGHLDVTEVVEVEMGKRVWWALVLEDWFAIPFRGVWAIHPDQMDTPIPFNCHSEDLQVGRYASRGDKVLTVAHNSCRDLEDMLISRKHRFSSQVASILQQVFQRLRPADTDALCIVHDATARIQKLLGSLPDCLSTVSSLHGEKQESGTPPFVPGMRHYIQISAQHKLLVINRAYLAHGGPKEVRARAHEACVQNAKAILQELDRGQQQGGAPMQSLWTIPYHSVAAAVVLALDMMKLSSDPATSPTLVRDRRNEIHRATQALQCLAPTSRIARRGLQVLSGLVGEINAVSPDPARSASNQMDSMITKMRLPSNDMIPSTLDAHAEWPLQLVPSSPNLGLYDHGVTGDPYGLNGDSHTWLPASWSCPAISVVTNDTLGGHPETRHFAPPFAASLDAASGQAHDNAHCWNQDDINRILSSLQDSLPDVGRLFDGSIGQF